MKSDIKQIGHNAVNFKKRPEKGAEKNVGKKRAKRRQKTREKSGRKIKLKTTGNEVEE